MSHTVMVGALRAFAAAAEQMGVDGQAVALRHVDAGLLDDPDGRVGFQAYRAAVAEFVDACGETIGLRAGASAAVGNTLEYLARTCSTWGEALGVVQRFAKLNADRLTVDLHERPEGVVLEAVAPIEVIPEVPVRIMRQSIEGYLAMIVALGRAITANDWNPTEVRFSYKQPADTREIEAFFRAPLKYQQDRSGLVFAPGLMKLAVVTADTQLNMILAACCATLLQELPKVDDLRTEVIRKLARAIPRGEHAIERIARQLGMSVRTLQRRLADEGLSFNDAVDETRRLLAQRYLAEDSLSIQDATLLLGYSDARAFHRAFKRWTGMTPADYRAEARA